LWRARPLAVEFGIRQHQQSIGETRHIPKVHLRAKRRSLAIEDGRPKRGHRLIRAPAGSQRGTPFKEALQVTSNGTQQRNGGQTLRESRGQSAIE
jgi:hypothetical protein